MLSNPIQIDSLVNRIVEILKSALNVRFAKLVIAEDEFTIGAWIAGYPCDLGSIYMDTTAFANDKSRRLLYTGVNRPCS